MIGVPRVERRRNRRMVVGERAFGHLQLAQQHRTGLAQLAHRGGVEGRHEIAVQRHARRGGHALGVAEVLYRDRHAVQLRQHLAFAEQPVGLARLRQCELGRHPRVRLQRRIDAFDAPEHLLGQLHR
jgi:hypothetical protein